MEKEDFNKPEEFEKETPPVFTEEDKKYAEELEGKKQQRRERRLKNIVGELTGVLENLSSREESDFEIVYEQIDEYEGEDILEETTKETKKILPSQSPAYGIFLRSKSNPEAKYEIMHLFREDVDAKVSKSDIRSFYQILAFKENLKKALEILKSQN